METHFCFVRADFFFLQGSKSQSTPVKLQMIHCLSRSQKKNTSNVKKSKQAEEKEGLIIHNSSPQNPLY